MEKDYKGNYTHHFLPQTQPSESVYGYGGLCAACKGIYEYHDRSSFSRLPASMKYAYYFSYCGSIEVIMADREARRKAGGPKSDGFRLYPGDAPADKEEPISQEDQAILKMIEESDLQKIAKIVRREYAAEPTWAIEIQSQKPDKGLVEMK